MVAAAMLACVLVWNWAGISANAPFGAGPVSGAKAGRATGDQAALRPLPTVSPVTFFEIPADQARSLNAATPFASVPNPAALPFRFVGDAVERERALTCLTAAAYYEAGDDAVGQRAVVQVILNRLRHPAFPKSVCGVIFEGAERSTGCQFTFTCDGALSRTPGAPAWSRARKIAEDALSGSVYAPVGNATHYHTDWVLPRWSPEMDKIGQVHTHLFFRWRGWWGQPGAFRRQYAGPEIMDPRIARLGSPLAATGAAVDPAAPVEPAIDPAPNAPVTIDGITAADLNGNIVRVADAAQNIFILQLDANAFPGTYAVLAWKICQNRLPCRVLGWRSAKDVPATLPVAEKWPSVASFTFEKGDANAGGMALWNCREMLRQNRAQCIPGTAAAPA